MTAKGLTSIYWGCPFYITIASAGKVAVHLPKQKKVGEVADAPVEIVHIKSERFTYPSDAHANNSDGSVNVVHKKPASDRSKQIANHQAVKEKDKEKLQKDCQEDI